LLTIYRDVVGGFPQSRLAKEEGDLPQEIIWIDLLNPTDDEKAFVEVHTRIRVPSVEALSEIESSSRLIDEKGIIYLSMSLVARGETPDPFITSAGFILTPAVLVTVRFAELPIFETVARKVREDDTIRTSCAVLIALLEALVDHGADVLERLGGDLDRISHSVFRGDQGQSRGAVRSNTELRRTLTAVGAIGDRLWQARVVFLGVGRVIPFLLSLPYDWIRSEFEARLKGVSKDVASLNEYEVDLSSKVQFLLDAVLGFITIEQNDLFKVLTIVSVVGIPPTLVAGIYGMNFKFMPELDWTLGYPFGLGVIALSALIPVVWFKWRGWF
jgi:magnesium transporter